MKNFILDAELQGCFNYFMDSTNFDKTANGYGCCLDRMNNKIAASVASTGFMLASLVIGAEHKWLDYEIAKEKAYLTLLNFYKNIPHFHGFFIHYVDINTGLRYRNCEYSTIDTVLFLNGALVVDNYFQDQKINQLVKKLLDRVEWDLFVKDYEGKKVFCMAYNEIVNGDYRHNSNSSWIYQWHMYAEQMNMYFLAASSDKISPDLALQLYDGFRREKFVYKNWHYVYCPSGTLFTYQFAHAWFDFAKYKDHVGFNWFENSRQAIAANRQFCIDHQHLFKTFNEYYWAISSCDGPRGYRSYGMPPYGYSNTANDDMTPKNVDGTVALYALVSSLPFLEEDVLTSLNKIFAEHPQILGKYGIIDSINLENEIWICQDYIGIDKGATMLMIENYNSGLIWDLYTNHPIIQKACQILQFKK